MITDVEPLSIPAEFRANSLVELVHRTVQRYPDKEALRWKLPRTRRQMGGPEDEAEAEVHWNSTTYTETWRWISEVAMGLKHLGIRDGDSVAIMSRTRPAWLTADIGALSLGAVTCPIYPSSEPGQAAFVINNVGARLIFVENLQQYNKIEKVRADCPTLEHVVVIEDRGQAPANGRQLRRHLRSRRLRARRAPRVGGELAQFRPRQGGDHRAYLRHHRQPQGRGADPREHPPQLRGGHPGGRLQ